MIAIIDYGAANLLSISRALEAVGAKTQITADPAEVSMAQAVVLPGVGAAASAMERLRSSGVDAALRRVASSGRPILGLCLGMQLFFDWLAEDNVEGLGILPGTVEPLPPGQKVPHIGWNNLRWMPERSGNDLFEGLAPGTYVYFVHSFHCRPGSPKLTIAWTDYGDLRIAAAVLAANICGLQFHPEKSGATGLTILRNWVRSVKDGSASFKTFNLESGPKTDNDPAPNPVIPQVRTFGTSIELTGMGNELTLNFPKERA